MTESQMAAKRKTLLAKPELTIGQAAYVLGTDASTLSHWMRLGLIGEKAGLVRHGRRVRFTTAKLRRWMKGGRAFKVAEAACEISKIIKRLAA